MRGADATFSEACCFTRIINNVLANLTISSSELPYKRLDLSGCSLVREL